MAYPETRLKKEDAVLPKPPRSTVFVTLCCGEELLVPLLHPQRELDPELPDRQFCVGAFGSFGLQVA